MLLGKDLKHYYKNVFIIIWKITILKDLSKSYKRFSDLS